MNVDVYCFQFLGKGLGHSNSESDLSDSPSEADQFASFGIVYIILRVVHLSPNLGKCS